jgi:hypothetical protein
MEIDFAVEWHRVSIGMTLIDHIRRANTLAQCPRKVCLRPSANSGTTIRRDVRPVNAAEYCFQLVTSSKGLAAWLGVTGHAVRSSGDIFACATNCSAATARPHPSVTTTPANSTLCKSHLLR